MRDYNRSLVEWALRNEPKKTSKNEAKIRERYKNIPRMAARCLFTMIKGVSEFPRAVIEHSTKHWGFFCKIEGRKKKSGFGFFRYNVKGKNKGKIIVYHQGGGVDMESLFQKTQKASGKDWHGFIKPTLGNVNYALQVLKSSHRNILQNKSGFSKISPPQEAVIDLGSYAGQWLALLDEKVVAHGKNLTSVIAKTKKVAKPIVFLKAPEDEVTVV